MTLVGILNLEESRCELSQLAKVRSVSASLHLSSISFMYIKVV